MRYYFGWQLMMSDVSQSVLDALRRYMDKMGKPPRILLVSDQLEEVHVPEDLNLVIRIHRVPKNILLIGDDEE